MARVARYGVDNMTKTYTLKQAAKGSKRYQILRTVERIGCITLEGTLRIANHRDGLRLADARVICYWLNVSAGYPLGHCFDRNAMPIDSFTLKPLS